MTQFEEECRAKVDQLRTVFVELYESIGADPELPQEAARTLHLNKTLTWNVARLLTAADALAAVNHVPGRSSLEKVITAIARKGADVEIVARAHTAVSEFHQMIEDHAGDRSTLDLIIDGSSGAAESSLELSRKLAFRGNSGLYGVQARTRVVCHFLAPNPEDPNLLDMVTVSGYVGFRRLRPSVRWPIFIVRAWTQDRQDALLQPEGWQPLEQSDEAAKGFPVMRTFTRGNVPEISAVANGVGRDFVLGEGPVGNEGAFDCFWGESMRRAVNRYAEHNNDTGEFGAAITAPAERLVTDIIAHKELEFALKPEVYVFGRIFAHGQPTGTNDDPSLLPIRQATVGLPGSPPRVNTTLVPKYPQIVQTVYDRMGWKGEDFRGVRLVMEYPPLGSNVILRFALPEQLSPRPSTADQN